MSEGIKHKISKIVVNNAENDLTTYIQYMEYVVQFIYFHWKIESAPTEGLNIKYVLEYTDGYSYEGVATVQLYDCEDNKLLGKASVRVE